MLFLVKHEHTAEMCPAGKVNPDKGFITRFDEQIKQSGVKWIEGYIDGPGHKFYLFIETDDIAKLIAAVKDLFVGENEIVPVAKFSDTIALAKKLGLQT